MIGIVIVAHGDFAAALLKTTAMIVGSEVPAMAEVTITGLEKPEQIRVQLQAAIKRVNQNQGVVIFTDMFGGTPSNIAISFLKKDEVEVVSGVNLPMLVDMIYSREGQSLGEFSKHLMEIGRNSICLAGEYLQTR